MFVPTTAAERGDFHAINCPFDFENTDAIVRQTHMVICTDIRSEKSISEGAE
jgi:hypothetical protein